MDASFFDEFKFPGLNVIHKDVFIGDRSAKNQRYCEAVRDNKRYTGKRVYERNDGFDKARQFEWLFRGSSQSQ